MNDVWVYEGQSNVLVSVAVRYADANTKTFTN